jgi:hypothetical protein
MGDNSTSRTPCPKCVALTYQEIVGNGTHYNASFPTRHRLDAHDDVNLPDSCKTLLCVRFQGWVENCLHDHPTCFPMGTIVLNGGEANADG